MSVFSGATGFETRCDATSDLLRAGANVARRPGASSAERARLVETPTAPSARRAQPRAHAQTPDGASTLTPLAADLGYADQAPFKRRFRRFADSSPAAFAARVRAWIATHQPSGGAARIEL